MTRQPVGLPAHVDIEPVQSARYDAARARPWRIVAWGVRLHRAGLLPVDAVAWCDAYALDCEATSRVTAGFGEGGGGSPGPRSPTDRVIAAARRLRDIRSRLTRSQVDLLDGALVQNYRISDLAISIGIHPRDDEPMAAFTGRVCRRVQERVASVVMLAMGDGRVVARVKSGP